MVTSVDPVEKLLLLQRKRALLAKKETLRTDFGLCFYRPYLAPDGTSPQDRFHRAGSFKHRLWEAGNKGGKTLGGTAEDCAFLLGERVWYPKSDPARTLGIPQKPNNGLIICADWDKVDELFTSERGTIGRLWHLLPKGSVKSRRRHSGGAIDLVELTNGSTIRFDTVKSWQVNPMGAESTDYDFIHIDEPCPEQMYKAHARGLIATGGKDWFNLTPITEPWIHDMFYPSRRGQHAGWVGERTWAMRTTTFDNTTLDKAEIEDYISSLTDDEKRCRIEGIPLEMSGLVFKEFDWDKHVLKEVPNGWANYNDPPANYTIYLAIDPHPQTPHHVLFLAVAPLGYIFLYDEVYVHCTIEELAEKINARLVGRFCPRQIMDPLGFIPHPITNTSMADEFMKAGLFLSKASKAREFAILKTRQTLKQVDRMWVAPDLTECLFEFSHWCWDTRENKPRDERDHAMENLGRLLLEDPVFIAQDANASASLPDLVIDRADMSLPDLSLD